MNANDVLELVRAGFTKEDIMSLAAPAPQAEEPAPQEEVSAAPSVSPIQAAPEAPAPDAGAVPEAVAAALENINATLSKLQQFAVRTDAQKVQPADTYKDVLGSIINRKD